MSKPPTIPPHLLDITGEKQLELAMSDLGCYLSQKISQLLCFFLPQ